MSDPPHESHALLQKDGDDSPKENKMRNYVMKGLIFSVTCGILYMTGKASHISAGVNTRLNDISDIVAATTAEHTNKSLPPQLSNLPRSQWISCDNYTAQHFSEMKAWETFWVDRLDHDAGFRKTMIDDENSMPHSEKTKVEGIKRLYEETELVHGCEYYSIGLSGPWNGARSKPHNHDAKRRLEALQRRQLTTNTTNSTPTTSPTKKPTTQPSLDSNFLTREPSTKPTEGPSAEPTMPPTPVPTTPVGDDDGVDDDDECTISDDFVMCSNAWNEVFIFVRTSTVEFRGYADATFDWTMDHEDCSVDMIPAGDVFMSIDITGANSSVSVTNDVLSRPSTLAEDSLITISAMREYFIFDLEMKNMNNDTCCMANWYMGIKAEFNAPIYHSDNEISITALKMDFRQTATISENHTCSNGTSVYEDDWF